MAWIKSHPHLLVLILISVAVLAGAGLLVKNTQEFNQTFDSVRQSRTKGTKVYQQDQAELEAAATEFKKPAAWSVPKKGLSLFVSESYKVNINEKSKLIPSDSGAYWNDSLTKEPIPDQWFTDRGLPLYTKGVTRMDPDGDGFPNEDEWREKTDPKDPKSHPPYYTKLFVQKYIKVPFLLRFQSIDGDPEKDKPENLTFGINTLSGRRTTSFLKVGDKDPTNKFKLEKFEAKSAKTANDTVVDVSELTLVNLETGEKIVLVKERITDSPDSYAEFVYLWPDINKPKVIRVKKLQEFVLLPESDLRYKLLDIDDTKAVIQTPSGEKVIRNPLPAGYP